MVKISSTANTETFKYNVLGENAPDTIFVWISLFIFVDK